MTLSESTIKAGSPTLGAPDEHPNANIRGGAQRQPVKRLRPATPGQRFSTAALPIPAPAPSAATLVVGIAALGGRLRNRFLWDKWRT